MKISSRATRTVLECPMELLKVRQQVGQSWTLSSLYVGWQATLYRNVALCTLFYGAADALKPFRDGMNPLMNGFFLGSIVATGVWWYALTIVVLISIFHSEFPIPMIVKFLGGEEYSKLLTILSLLLLLLHHHHYHPLIHVGSSFLSIR